MPRARPHPPIHDVKIDAITSLPESDLEQFVSGVKQKKLLATPNWADEIGHGARKRQ
jgi:hypothetical protein